MKYYSIIKAIQDMLTDYSRKRIPQEEISRYCTNLANTITEKYKPDIVIAIDKGGSVPGKLIAKILNIPVEHITIRRNINIGRMYNLDPIPLRWIMSIYHHFLFHTTKPKISKKLTINISNKKVLIVDDSFHTGSTIDIAINYLTKYSVSEIKTATLTHVSSRKPDFSILPQGNYCFPWSMDFIDDSQSNKNTGY